LTRAYLALIIRDASFLDARPHRAAVNGKISGQVTIESLFILMVYNLSTQFVGKCPKSVHIKLCSFRSSSWNDALENRPSVDVETTDTVRSLRPILRAGPVQLRDDYDTYQTLVNPGRSISPGARINGLRDMMQSALRLRQGTGVGMD
jgi:hypothetical protein